jgi:MFS family permease
MPFLLLAYLICYIDRVNVGFASLQMNKAVGIDPKTYGLGAGIFFVGYFILEVPSNLALERFGARTWIARIMITWGLVSAAFALIGGPISFLVLRFLLGAAEAGFLSGRDPLHHLLVPGALPRDHRRHLHGGDPGGRVGWFADFWRDSLHGRTARAGRLAVDLPA